MKKNKFPYLPINDSLVALGLDAEDETIDAGVILPQTGKAGAYTEGVVVAVSPNLTDDSGMAIRPGMVVVWRRGHAGVDLYCNGKHYHRLGIAEIHMVRVAD